MLTISVNATALASIAGSFSTILVAPAIRAVREDAEPEIYANIREKGGVILGFEQGQDWDKSLRAICCDLAQ